MSLLKNAVDTFRKFDGKNHAMEKRKPIEAADSEVKARTCAVRQSYNTASSTGEPLPTGGVLELCELWQHFSSEFCRNRDLGTTTGITAPKVLPCPMSPHGHLLPFPPQTHFLSVAIEEFPLFYQSSTAPRILDIATIILQN